MAHAESHAEVEGVSVDRPKLLYGLNDKPPFKYSYAADKGSTGVRTGRSKKSDCC